MSKMPKLKQATLSSLKGVVVVEDFTRHKNLIENSAESKDNILSSLNYLKKKKPSREVILAIGIDKSLNNLKNHSDKDIVEATNILCAYWELEGKVKVQPLLEVRYDNLTLHIRRNAIKFFMNALGGTEEDEKTADIIEKEIFHHHKRLISKEYRRTVRKIVFALRHQENVKLAIKEGKLTQVELVKKFTL